VKAASFAIRAALGWGCLLGFPCVTAVSLEEQIRGQKEV
jgi:hypothetical protein